MALTVANQIYVSLAIDGTDLPIGPSTFSKFEMIENISAKLPTIEIAINDPLNMLSQFVQLSDGSILTACLHSDLGYDYGAPQTVDYLVQGMKIDIGGASLNYLVNGIYNAPQYLAGVVQNSYKGSSDSVITQLAGECGLTAQEPDSTNDQMTHLPTRETYHDFIRRIIDHSYVDGSSVMSHGVTADGNLIMKNLTSLATAPATRIVASGGPTLTSDMIQAGIIPMMSWSCINMAGLANFTYNYGLKLVQEQMTGMADLFNQFTATLMSGDGLDLSSTVQSAVGGLVRSEYLPHDMGNTHQNFYNAEYQNRRGRQLFTTTCEFITATSTGLNIYDVVDFEPLSPVDATLFAPLCGNYIVSAKKKFLSGSEYREKITIMSQ